MLNTIFRECPNISALKSRGVTAVAAFRASTISSLLSGRMSRDYINNHFGFLVQSPGCQPYSRKPRSCQLLCLMAVRFDEENKMLNKPSMVALSLLLVSYATPGMTESAGSDLNAFDALSPYGASVQGVFSGSYAAPRYAKAEPASGYITWKDDQGKAHQLNITQVRQSPNDSNLWLGDNTERGFWLMDVASSRDSTGGYTGRMVKGVAFHFDIGPASDNN
jgi:hypothetical protein